MLSDRHQSPNARPAVSIAETARAYACCDLNIGLVNNMPDAALRRTERQFMSLLKAAAGNRFKIRVYHFSMREIRRSDAALLQMRGRYIDASMIAHHDLDALIVTGSEPQANCLEEEPHWSSLARLIDIATERAISTVWSCLAAHAAVLRLDRVQRRSIGRKRIGLFECVVAKDHSLIRELPPRIVMPHSRYHEISEDDLRRADYQILSRSDVAGVDAFVKDFGGFDFVFFQGHPEYDSDTILREYRRDALRFFSGSCGAYPSIPLNCFDADLEDRLMDLARRAHGVNASTLTEELLSATQDFAPPNRWQDHAAAIYRNWLTHLVDIKQLRAPTRLPFVTHQ